MKIELDMYQTLAVAVLVLMLGKFLRARVQVLERFCIPAPVIGGVLFAIFTCVCYVTGVAEFAFDDILKEVCMVMFFTSVGFQANLKVLKSGGRAMIVFLGVVIVLIVSQNFVAVGLAKLLGVDALVGLCTGSIPMVGGHGTAGAFGPVLEDFGIQGATTLCTAAATYGLIAGSMMGGPIGKMLIERHNLLATVVPEDDSLLVEEEMKHERHTTMYPAASFQLIVAMGIGTVLSRLLSLTGMTFPIYIGAMIAAAIIRNVGEYGGGYTVYMGEINDIGGICLSLFLGMAMITLKLWQLAELALPLIVLLAGQTLFMILYVVLVVFNIMGRDYDAAVIVSGTCGFGMGATPNAMANMQAVSRRYGPSPWSLRCSSILSEADLYSSGGLPHRERRRAMSLYHHLKTWLGKKREHPHEEETVAVPEIHTGKVAHHTDADGTPAADKPIHYDNVAIPEVHIHPRRK